MSSPFRILYFPKYTRQGASSRLRTFQYLPLLEKKGIIVHVSSFFNDQYLLELYNKKPISKWNVIRCYIRRFKEIFIISKFDLVIIEKELFPYLPAWIERYLSYRGIKYIVDYDDAIFHNYDLNRSYIVRYFLGNKIDAVMAKSWKVFSGNAYISERAKIAGAKNIIHIPTVIDTERYLNNIKAKNKSLARIGWIGSPTTLRYLKDLLPIFERLKESFDFELAIIGGKGGIGFSGNEIIIEWSEKTEVAEIRKMNIGIMPLHNNPWEQGKCSYKLIQYLAAGIPVIGSSVGMNMEVIHHGSNGYLVSNLQEWEEYLQRFLKEYSIHRKFLEVNRPNPYTLQKYFKIYYTELGA